MSDVLTRVGFLLRRKRKNSSVAHAWVGGDTACRMWSTGGIRKAKYEFSVSAEGHRLCQMCVNVLGYDPSDESGSLLDYPSTQRRF